MKSTPKDIDAACREAAGTHTADAAAIYQWLSLLNGARARGDRGVDALWNSAIGMLWNYIDPPPELLTDVAWVATAVNTELIDPEREGLNYLFYHDGWLYATDIARVHRCRARAEDLGGSGNGFFVSPVNLKFITLNGRHNFPIKKLVEVFDVRELDLSLPITHVKPISRDLVKISAAQFNRRYILDAYNAEKRMYTHSVLQPDAAAVFRSADGNREAAVMPIHP